MPVSNISLEGLAVAHVTDSGVTRAQFANSVGCKTWRTLKNKMRGDAPLLFSEAVALCKQLGISLDDLSYMI